MSPAWRNADGSAQPGAAAVAAPGPEATGGQRRRRSRWLLPTMAVAAPAGASGVFGFVLAVEIAQIRGAQLRLPAWLGSAAYLVSLVALITAVLQLLVGMVATTAQRVVFISTAVTGLMCGLTAGMLPW